MFCFYNLSLIFFLFQHNVFFAKIFYFRNFFFLFYLISFYILHTTFFFSLKLHTTKLKFVRFPVLRNEMYDRLSVCFSVCLYVCLSVLLFTIFLILSPTVEICKFSRSNYGRRYKEEVRQKTVVLKTTRTKSSSETRSATCFWCYFVFKS